MMFHIDEVIGILYLDKKRLLCHWGSLGLSEWIGEVKRIFSILPLQLAIER
jgi:hypothetical protein